MPINNAWSSGFSSGFGSAAFYQWPIDKLTLINSALALTGDNQISALNDGSDEYTVASPAYERAIAYMTESHGWGFTTRVNPNLSPSIAAPVPTDTNWDTAYDLPPDLVHLIWVRISGVGELVTNVPTLAPTPYVICENQLWVNAQGGPPPPNPPVTPAIVSIKYISNINANATLATPTFIIALQAFTISGIYRGLHEDTVEADKTWAAGEHYLQVARTRYDQQNPKRAFFNHRITAARRIRRPWPTSGGNEWGGTGVPG